MTWMNEKELKEKIITGISKQTGLELRIINCNDNIKLCLEYPRENYWKYTNEFPADCNIPYFLKQIADLLQDYLFVMKLKEDDE